MNANEIQIRHFLAKDGAKFVIPVYQRNYDWKQKQCRQLLIDLETITSDSSAYFIGSIVHQSVRNLTNDTELIIIDGQQRITTITLLLYVLSKRFEDFGEDMKSIQIKESFLFNKFDNNKNKLKLKPVHEDNEALINVVSGNISQVENGNRIRENYEFFYNSIDTLEKANMYYDSFPKLTIVEISLDERDNPQKIFQSLNSTGLELSQADLVRNYILMNLEYQHQEEFYRKYWSVIEKNCRNSETYDSQLSLFIRDYLTLKSRRVPSKKNVYDEFALKYTELDSQIEKLEDILKDMLIFSNHYNTMINYTNGYSKELLQELRNINQIEVSVAYPFLLGVFDLLSKQVITEQEVVEILKLIQNYVIRRYIVDLPSNALQKIFMTLFGNAQKLFERNPEGGFVSAVSAVLIGYTSYQRFPTDKEVLEGIKTKDIYKSQARRRNFLLEYLENNLDEFNEHQVVIDEREDISIEHIFPQNPSNDLKEKLGEEQFTKMQSFVNTLGNLTFVINNSSLGNRPFLEKLNLNKPESKGFKYSKFNLNASLQNLTSWNLDELQKRSTILSNRLIELMKYPVIDTNDYVLEEELPVSIDQIEDPTGTQPKAVHINGSKKSVLSNREMYNHVVDTLFTKEPEAFYTPIVKEKLSVSSNKDELSVAGKLGEDLFYEQGLSSKSIYFRIMELLEHTKEDYEILVQLKREDE